MVTTIVYFATATGKFHTTKAPAGDDGIDYIAGGQLKHSVTIADVYIDTADGHLIKP